MKPCLKLNKFNQEIIPMMTRRLMFVISTIIIWFAGVAPVHAQDFSQIESTPNSENNALREGGDPSNIDPVNDDSANSDPMAADPAAAIDPSAPPPSAATGPTGETAAVEPSLEDEKIKEVMGKDEYKQFVAAKAYAERASTYTLGPTDLIDITVLRHPEVSGQYTINMEGKIQYEFVGDLPVSGYTKEQVTEVIAKKLSTYIVNPQVTVKIVGYNSKIVYVVGEVGRPGKIFMRGDTISVREALLDAGLPLLSANTSKASMFTPSDKGKVERRSVNVDDLLYKGDLRQNFVMRPGDTLYLPATFWAKAMRVITPVTQPVGQAASAGRTVVGY
jgi:polysaccharide biosynthesis/export protein